MSDAPQQNEPRPVKTYRAPDIEVTFDAKRCIHAAECVRGLPDVFDVGRRPWVLPDRASAEAVADAIRRCPSGALQYARLDGSTEIPDSPTSVRLDPDGPIYLRGDLVITTPNGTMRETRASLCGCGRSMNAPFCDNTHRNPVPEES